MSRPTSCFLAFLGVSCQGECQNTPKNIGQETQSRVKNDRPSSGFILHFAFCSSFFWAPLDWLGHMGLHGRSPRMGPHGPAWAAWASMGQTKETPGRVFIRRRRSRPYFRTKARGARMSHRAAQRTGCWLLAADPRSPMTGDGRCRVPPGPRPSPGGLGGVWCVDMEHGALGVWFSKVCAAMLGVG
jgi:hypothetical protein